MFRGRHPVSTEGRQDNELKVSCTVFRSIVIPHKCWRVCSIASVSARAVILGIRGTLIQSSLAIAANVHTQKKPICHVDMKVCYLRCIISVHIKITNFLVEMTNYHVILTEECGDAPLITLSVLTACAWVETITPSTKLVSILEFSYHIHTKGIRRPCDSTTQ